jgi:GntR family transcriptional regulator
MPRRATAERPAPPAQAASQTAPHTAPGLPGFEREALLPLHHQVRAHLARLLRAGHFVPGTPMPGEPELCLHYRVSRGTLRHALAELARDGLIDRQQGRGSFARAPKREGAIAGSYRRFRADGPPLDPGCRLLGLRRVPASAEVAEALSLPPGAPSWRLERLRCIQGEPAGIQLSWLPAGLCPALQAAELEQRHLVDVLRDRWGVEFSHADEFIEPAIADARTAKRLGIPAGTPMFRLERRTWLPNGRLGEYRHALMRGDLYRYRVELR